MSEKKSDRPSCFCGKPAKFLSSLFNQGFCSDNCYEMAQLSGKSLEDAHIIKDRKGQAYFRQGDVRFTVDAKDLNEVVGCNGGSNVIDKLMDSQVAMLASANGLVHDPFVRELLRPVLTGVVQLVWYRDLQKHESDNLRINQARRVVKYHVELREYTEPPKSDSSQSEAPSRASKSPRSSRSFSASYRFLKSTKEVASGREAQLLEVVKELKQGTLAQIVEAAKDRVKTKQDPQTIIIRFLRELVAHGAVEEIA